MRRNPEMPSDIRSIFSSLRGHVPDGILERVVRIGGIPDKGPGRKSIPNAFKRIRFWKDTPDAKSKDQRRQENLNNKSKG